MEKAFTSIELSPIIKIAIVVVIAIIALLISKYIFSRIFKKHMQADRKRFCTITRVIASITKALIAFIAILWIMAILGYNVKSFIAGLGLVSAVIGLALQDTLKDYLMGLHIIFDESMDIGSLVTINGYTGIVESFTLRTTKLFDINQAGTIYICNRDIVTIQEGFPFIDIEVPVSSSNSYDDISETFNSFGDSLVKINGVTKAEYVGVSRFVDNGNVQLVRVWCDLKNVPTIKRNCNTAILRELEKSGIELIHSKIEMI